MSISLDEVFIFKIFFIRLKCKKNIESSIFLFSLEFLSSILNFLRSLKLSFFHLLKSSISYFSSSNSTKKSLQKTLNINLILSFKKLSIFSFKKFDSFIL